MFFTSALVKSALVQQGLPEGFAQGWGVEQPRPAGPCGKGLPP